MSSTFGELSVATNTQVINHNSQIDQDDAATRQALLLELQKQLMSKENLKKPFEESYAETSQELTGARMSGTHAASYGQAYAGFVGSSSEYFKGNLNVSNTTASGHGFAAAGVVHGVSFPSSTSSTSMQKPSDVLITQKVILVSRFTVIFSNHALGVIGSIVRDNLVIVAEERDNGQQFFRRWTG